MDRSIRQLPDPATKSLPEERRRCVRQKLHTPVYASFSGPETQMVVDLSELLDLHEEGFAVQTAERLETNRVVNVCLDLPETKSYVHGVGQVIWSDDTGRGGIRFSALAEDSRQTLKQWLFANLLIATSNHAIRSEQIAQYETEKLSEFAPVPADDPQIVVSDQAQQISSLDLMCREVRDLMAAGDDEAILDLIVQRARSLTGASGAALALLADEQMIWRARVGNLAPPLGASVDLNHGLSGECFRSGMIVSCEDTEIDPRIDREAVRGLGIGSLVASPIFSDFKVIGLLESSRPVHVSLAPSTAGYWNDWVS